MLKKGYLTINNTLFSFVLKLLLVKHCINKTFGYLRTTQAHIINNLLKQ